MRLTALMTMLALILLAGFVVLRSPGGYAAQDREHLSARSSAQHWTGTDALGRDRTVRTAAALLLDLGCSVAAAALVTAIAAAVGITAAFAHPLLAQALLYASDVLLTLPWLYLLMMVRASMPLTMTPYASAGVTFLLFALLAWPVYARITYGGASAVRHSGWMLQGRASGMKTGRLLRRFVLPHLKPLLLSEFLLCVPAALAAEANLGTLGLGVADPLPSWGSMLQALGSPAAITGSAWIYLPVVLLVIVLLALEWMAAEGAQ